MMTISKGHLMNRHPVLQEFRQRFCQKVRGDVREYEPAFTSRIVILAACVNAIAQRHVWDSPRNALAFLELLVFFRSHLREVLQKARKDSFFVSPSPLLAHGVFFWFQYYWHFSYATSISTRSSSAWGSPRACTIALQEEEEKTLRCSILSGLELRSDDLVCAPLQLKGLES